MAWSYKRSPFLRLSSQKPVNTSLPCVSPPLPFHLPWFIVEWKLSWKLKVTLNMSLSCCMYTVTSPCTDLLLATAVRNKTAVSSYLTLLTANAHLAQIYSSKQHKYVYETNTSRITDMKIQCWPLVDLIPSQFPLHRPTFQYYLTSPLHIMRSHHQAIRLKSVIHLH